MHINDVEQRTWLQRRIEGDVINFTPEGKKAILNKLIEAEGFEKFASNRLSAPSGSAWTARNPPFRRWNRSSSAAASWVSARSCWAWPIAGG